MTPLSKTKKNSAFSIIEIVVTLLIVAGLGLAVVSILQGLRKKDAMDRAIQRLHDDIMYMRSRAISTNLDHRLFFDSDSSWHLERSDGGGGWEAVSEVRSMSSGTNLTSTSYPSKADKLEATPRGLFDLNSATGDPFVTLESTGVGYTKSLHVDVGGAVEITLD